MIQVERWLADETTSNNTGDFDGLNRLGRRCVGGCAK